MQYFLFGLVGLAVMLMLMQGFTIATAAAIARAVRLAGGFSALSFGTVLMVRGYALYGFWMSAFGTYLLMRLAMPGPWSWPNMPRGARRDVSRVRTEHLDVELEHGSGAVRGHVLKGFFAGRDLETLRPVELAHLWADCQFSDPPSAQILEAYLDRIHPSWREDMARAGERSGAHGADEARTGARASAHDGRMSREEACDILGVRLDASEDEIRRAHRDLMLKVHPDRGGSHILAAKVNEAKDVLIR